MVRSGICLALVLLWQAPAWADNEASVARRWRAWIETAEGGEQRLHVKGEVKAGVGEPALSDNRLQGFNPAILFLDLKLPHRFGAKRFKPVRFERVGERINITEVDIFLDNGMIARIPVRTRR